MTFNERYKNNALLLKTFAFSLKIMDYSEILQEKRKYVLANQILKSGTSIGANSKEAQNAESKADFIHKLKIAMKEADEVEYWLLLCKHSKYLTSPNEEMFQDLKAIQLIISKIISTSKS